MVAKGLAGVDVQFVDTHCHLDAQDFDADRDQLVALAQEQGVGKMIVPSVDMQNFAAVKACCHRYALCLPAYGIHPLYVSACRDDDLATLRRFLHEELAKELPPVAVGEIGLDFFVPGLDLARQTFFFNEQLKIARDLDLPVLLHVRRAVDQILKSLRQFGIHKGIAHAFNGSLQQAEAFIKLGFKLGFGGAMTFPRATRIRTLARELPAEVLVLETDAPDIAPAWIAGARNVPHQLPAIAAELARIRGVSVDEVASFTAANAETVVNRGIKP